MMLAAYWKMGTWIQRPPTTMRFAGLLIVGTSTLLSDCCKMSEFIRRTRFAGLLVTGISLLSSGYYRTRALTRRLTTITLFGGLPLAVMWKLSIGCCRMRASAAMLRWWVMHGAVTQEKFTD